MQFPILVGLRRSRFLASAVVFAWAVAEAVLIATPWEWSLRVLLIGAACAVAGRAWQRSWQLPVAALLLEKEGGLAVRLGPDDAFVDATLHARPFVHPLLTVLPLVLADTGARHPVVLLPDTLEADQFRRLRVWLRTRLDEPASDSTVDVL